MCSSLGSGFEACWACFVSKFLHVEVSEGSRFGASGAYRRGLGMWDLMSQV